MEEGLARVKARGIVTALGLDEPDKIDVEAIAMFLGLLCVPTTITGAEGRLVRGANGGVIRVRTGNTTEGRRRFTIAHEIGHFELHRDKQSSRCTAADLHSWAGPGRVEEYQANVFAAELLMPERLFAFHCRGVRPCLDHVDYLSGLFRTSLTATAIRFVEFCREECAVVFSKNGRICWSYPGLEFRFKYLPHSDLDQYTLAYDHFHKGSGERTQQSIDASAWFPQIKFRQNAMLKEQSWKLGDYSAVLTLLWIDQEI